MFQLCIHKQWNKQAFSVQQHWAGLLKRSGIQHVAGEDCWDLLGVLRLLVNFECSNHASHPLPQDRLEAFAGPFSCACWSARSKVCSFWNNQAHLYLSSTQRGCISSMPCTNSMGWNMLGSQSHLPFQLKRIGQNIYSISYNRIGLAKVRRVSWWMGRYGANTPKRQWAWANSPAILRFDIGWRKMISKVATCVKYVNKEGKRCYKGSRQLKGTEILNKN